MHEYAGASFTAHKGVVYFCHFLDQRVYAVCPGKEPFPLTPESRWRYADLQVDPWRRQLIAVAEDHSSGGEARNFITAIDLEGKRERQVLCEGHDFFASPRLSPDGAKLAWLSWDHPNMPWDSTTLWVAAFDESGRLKAPQKVAGGEGESIFQPEWSPDGTLHFVSDKTGWWNLYRLRESGLEPLCPMDAEFGLPQWVFGLSTYAFDPKGRLLCTYLKDGFGNLAWCESGRLIPIPSPFQDFQLLKAGKSAAAFIGGSPSRAPEVVRVDFTTLETATVRRCREDSIDRGFLSIPQALRFPSVGGREAHAFFYPPCNRDFEASDSGELPPLMVISHGGPTGASSPTLDLSRQFWTSRGFAILDVNYGGSTGYGRKYRDLLKGNWGIIDVEDCIEGARYLAAQRLVDGNRMLIRGGSAGGYTTLCALTFHQVFCAGASYFGVSDLKALLADTHKFESRYDAFLIGPPETSAKLYQERSPIHHTDRLNCPIILFQGLEDRVVPPNQSEMIFEAARQKKLPVAYLPFPGEQHGFRKAENIARAIQAELYFYSRILGFTPAEPIAPVRIENLD